MRIRYKKPDGDSVTIELGDKPLTVGRSPEADIIVFDDRASRIHCGLRFWDGEYYVKDLKSKNGTLLNDKPVDVSKIRGGDIIRIGASTLMIEDGDPTPSMGANTAIRQIGGEMDGGKGYSTLLRQIVSDVPTRGAPPVVPISLPHEESQHLSRTGDLSESKKLGTGPIKVGVKKAPVRITIRRNPPAG